MQTEKYTVSEPRTDAEIEGKDITNSLPNDSQGEKIFVVFFFSELG